MRIKIAANPPKSEFEIQAEALALLKDALGPSYVVKGEWTYGRCRFDLAIFKAESRDLVCTIEIKRRGGIQQNHLQLNRYHRATGKPCILFTGDTVYRLRTLKELIPRIVPTRFDRPDLQEPKQRLIPARTNWLEELPHTGDNREVWE